MVLDWPTLVAVMGLVGFFAAIEARAGRKVKVSRDELKDEIMDHIKELKSDQAKVEKIVQDHALSMVEQSTILKQLVKTLNDLDETIKSLKRHHNSEG